MLQVNFILCWFVILTVELPADVEPLQVLKIYLALRAAEALFVEFVRFERTNNLVGVQHLFTANLATVGKHFGVTSTAK